MWTLTYSLNSFRTLSSFWTYGETGVCIDSEVRFDFWLFLHSFDKIWFVDNGSESLSSDMISARWSLLVVCIFIYRDLLTRSVDRVALYYFVSFIWFFLFSSLSPFDITCDWGALGVYILVIIHPLFLLYYYLP